MSRFDYGNGRDEWIMAANSFSYCLGRTTWVVSKCSKFLIRNAEKFNSDEREYFILNIERSIEQCEAGMDMDVEEWIKALAALKEAQKCDPTKPTT